MEEKEQLTESQQKLAEKNVEFAEGIAKAMYRTDIEIGELTGAAYEGLSQAALRWRPGCGTAFRSFAYHRIVGAIKDDIALIKGYKRGDVLSHAGDVFLSHAEPAENAEGNTCDVETHGRASNWNISRRDTEPAENAKGNTCGVQTEHAPSLTDIDKPEPSYDPWEQIDNQVTINLLIKKLPPNDRVILTQFFGLNNEKQLSNEEICKKWKISESTLRRKVRTMIMMMK